MEQHLVSALAAADGIVDWRSCLDPAARQVHVPASHLGMAIHPGVYRAIAEELGQLDDHAG